jgi:hypothetical protein
MQAVKDAVAYVRQRPERFCQAGFPNPVELATNLVSEALILGGHETCTLRQGEWWIIGSEVDWLRTHPDYSPRDLFFRIVAFPEAGANSMRAEILLTAFAHKVITVSGDGRDVIKGRVSQTAGIWRVLESRLGWTRAVAFCFAPDCAPS